MISDNDNSTKDDNIDESYCYDNPFDENGGKEDHSVYNHRLTAYQTECQVPEVDRHWEVECGDDPHVTAQRVVSLLQ